MVLLKNGMTIDQLIDDCCRLAIVRTQSQEKLNLLICEKEYNKNILAKFFDRLFKINVPYDEYIDQHTTIINFCNYKIAKYKEILSEYTNYGK